jgi:glutamate/tyrosine decarboxylase-like PLP-dependent enzyme
VTGTEIIPGQLIHAQVPNPLYSNIENSRRFRALPLFASLISLGKDGYRDIIQRNIAFARQIAQYIQGSTSYELLNPSPKGVESIVPLNIVLFRGSASSHFPPSQEGSSTKLTEAINLTRRIYVTGTKWRGQGAIRLAVSNWRTGLNENDFEEVKSVLEQVMQQ